MEESIKHITREQFFELPIRARRGLNAIVLEFLANNPDKAFSVNALAEHFKCRPSSIKAWMASNWRGLPLARRSFNGEAFVGFTEDLSPEDIKRKLSFRTGAQGG